MHYVNLAAAIATLASALRAENDAIIERDECDILATRDEWRYLRQQQRECERFTAGVSYAIGMMLDPATAAIIEQAARERAEETTS